MNKTKYITFTIGFASLAIGMFTILNGLGYIPAGFIAGKNPLAVPTAQGQTPTEIHSEHSSQPEVPTIEAAQSTPIVAPESAPTPASPVQPAVKGAVTPAIKPTLKKSTTPTSSTSTPTTPKPQPVAAVSCSGGLTTQFFCLLNQYRASKGLGKVSMNSSLAAVALGHSQWMNSTGTFSHVGINGSRLGERCAAAGITCRGENLAYNATSAQNLLDMWKASPTHNAILLGGYSTAGMGVSGAYITLLFN